MKYTFFLLCLSTLIGYGQELETDTVFHTHLDEIERLVFQLPEGSWSKFEFGMDELEIEAGETTKQQSKVDFLQLFLYEKSTSKWFFKYRPDKEWWKKKLLGKECLPDWWEEVVFEELSFYFDFKTNELQYHSCGANVEQIKKGFTAALACIEGTEDERYLKDALETWLAETDSCEFQEKLILFDLQWLFAYLNTWVPKDSILSYSITPRKEELKKYATDLMVKKEFSANGDLVYTFAEDLSNKKSLLSLMVKEGYDILKDDLLAEEQRRDSIRLNSIKEIDYQTLEINAENEFKVLRSYRETRRLNIDLDEKISRVELWLRRVE